jgi:RNA polymerase primary sigma factor
MAPSEASLQTRYRGRAQPAASTFGALRQERILRAARRGDPRARERVVLDHLGLVRRIASRYRHYGVPLEDLVQEGALGLLDAIDHYDSSYDVDFERYARFRVRRAIRNALTEQARVIRLPKQIVDRRRLLDRLEAQLLAAGGRPTTIDLAAASGLSIGSVVEARSAPPTPLSLDEPFLADGTGLASVVTDPSVVDPARQALNREWQTLVHEAIRRLPSRKRRVVTAHWGLDGTPPLTTSQLARELRLSPRRTQTITSDALAELADEIGTSVR